MDDTVKGGTRLYNDIEETKIYFSNLTGNFIETKDLGFQFLYTHLSIKNTFDKDIYLQFTDQENNKKQITIEANEDYIYDDFNHHGILKIKPISDIPTKGYIFLRSW